MDENNRRQTRGCRTKPHIAAVRSIEAVQRGVNAVKNARQVEKTKDLFLGQKAPRTLQKNYERAAAVLSHAATPVINQGDASAR